MPIFSLRPETAIDEDEGPLRAGTEEIAQYLAQESGPGIESVYTRQIAKGMFISVKGQQGEERYFLAKLRAPDKPDKDGSARTNEANEQTQNLTGPECTPKLRLDQLSAGPERTVTLAQLLQLNLARPPAVIEGVLHEGETVVVAGRQKVGKSRLTQQMALCLANGEPFLGMRVPKPVRVLMIDLENGLPSLSERFRTMSGQRSGDQRLFIWCAQSLDSVLPDAGTGGAERLRALVDEVNPDVLIIDPWRLWLNGDENDAREIVKGLKALASVRRHHPQIVIVIVHHVRKEKFESPKRLLRDPSLWADAVSGHHALMSHVDACFGLERQADDDDGLIVFGGIARNALPSTLILDEDESLRFSVAANEDAALKVMTDAQRQIWEKIKGLKKLGFSEAVAAAKTKNKKAVSAALKTEVSHGLLLKQGDLYVSVRV